MDHHLRRVATGDMVKHRRVRARLEDITLRQLDMPRSPATRPKPLSSRPTKAVAVALNMARHRMDMAHPRHNPRPVDQAIRPMEAMDRRHRVVTRK